MSVTDPQLNTILKDICVFVRTELRSDLGIQSFGFTENNLFSGRPQKMKKVLMDPLMIVEIMDCSEGFNGIVEIEANPLVQVTTWRGVGSEPLKIYDINDRVKEVLKSLVDKHAKIKEVKLVSFFVNDDDFFNTDLKKGVVRAHIIFWE